MSKTIFNPVVTNLNLPIPADLSSYQFLQAQATIEKELEKHKREVYYTLHVPSQLFGVAMKIAYLAEVNIVVNTTFDEDEWKLEGKVIVAEKDICTWYIVNIYSPGA